MFTVNLLKKPLMDAKRQKAVEYFNGKFPNSPVIEKSPFWSFNRVKILLSVIVALMVAWGVLHNLPRNELAFPLLMISVYIAYPFLCFLKYKNLPATKINKVKFIKVANKIYRQSELPAALAISAFFLSIINVISFAYVIDKINNSYLESFLGGLLFLSPFVMYNLLCFIGNHPFVIFAAAKYLPKKLRSNYIPNPSLSNSSSGSFHDNTFAPNGMRGQTGWAAYYSDNS